MSKPPIDDRVLRGHPVKRSRRSPVALGSGVRLFARWLYTFLHGNHATGGIACTVFSSVILKE